MFTNLRIKIREFFRKYKYIIILVIIGFAIVITVNEFFKEYKAPVIPQTLYNPNKPIISEGEEVPQEEQEPIQKLFDEYISYCNKKEYENAYNMLSTKCKEVVYPTIEDYKRYIDAVFDQKKIYNIQNMSNIDEAYIYRVRYLNDILATGLTEGEEVWYDEDIVTVVTENEQKKLNIREYIKTDELNRVYENEYMKIEIEPNEVVIQAGGMISSYEKEYNNKMVIKPGQTGYYTLMFDKSYDLSSKTQSMKFNKVRILKSYTGKEETKEEELKNAEAVYSLEIDI